MAINGPGICRRMPHVSPGNDFSIAEEFAGLILRGFGG
jgi:hypothetical protein